MRLSALQRALRRVVSSLQGPHDACARTPPPPQRRMSQNTGESARSPLGLPMLAPTHPFVAGWSVALLLLDLTYTAILLPLAFGFRLNKEPGWLELSIVVGMLFTVDMLVMLHRYTGGRGSPSSSSAPAAEPVW